MPKDTQNISLKTYDFGVDDEQNMTDVTRELFGSTVSNMTKIDDAIGEIKQQAITDKTSNQVALDGKVDKVSGKKLSTEDYTSLEKTKLTGIEDNANNYIHPLKHDADIITDNASKRFASDVEKGKWNTVLDKADKTYVDTELGKKSTKIEVNAHTSDISNPHSVTKTQVGLGNVENKTSATIRGEITNSNVTSALGFTPENVAKKGVASGYASLDSHAKIPLTQIPDTARQQTYVVSNLVERGALVGLITGERCYITSTGDSYVWDGMAWKILAKADWENVNLQWSNILDKPSSVVAEIDSAVTQKHSHSNKTIIDKVTQVLIDRWNSAWDHISDVVSHITSEERARWNNVDNKADKAQVLTNVPSGALFTDTVYTHPTAAGNKHIPTGGAVGQVLKNTASGTATWQAESKTTIANNLTETATGKALDATQGKFLIQQLNEIETDLTNHKADYASKFLDNAGAHNSIFRGKYLGASVTAEQYASIQNGTFTDLYIGDYWTIGGINWRIAAFNYYRNTGDTLVPGNHITIVSDTQLYGRGMNPTNITTGGYVGSDMYINGLEQAKTTIRGIFGSHLIKHRQILSNATVDGKASGWAWADSEVDLMTEIMVYGSVVWGESTIGGSGYNIGVGKSQLPLFALNPQSINTRQSYWLRDVVSGAGFALAYYGGSADCSTASDAYGVRPAFSIS